MSKFICVKTVTANHLSLPLRLYLDLRSIMRRALYSRLPAGDEDDADDVDDASDEPSLLLLRTMTVLLLPLAVPLPWFMLAMPCTKHNMMMISPGTTTRAYRVACSCSETQTVAR